MSLVSVSRTGNESDIIEAFVRHHASIFDLMLIIDDNSTDGTAEILDKLKEGGFPIVIFKANSVAWNQLDFVTHLMHLAARKFNASWIFPLDIDEFVEVANPQFTLPDILEQFPEQVMELRWSNFAWFGSGESDPAVNPVVRLRQRGYPRADNSKVAVPGQLVRSDPSAKLTHGNHRVVINGVKPRVLYHREIALCHYPIRSLEQITSKVVINYLRYMALPNRDVRLATQYVRPFQLMGDKPALIAELERQSLAYSLAPGHAYQEGLVDQPLLYLGGALIFTDKTPDAFRNIVRHAEAMALYISTLEEKSAAPGPRKPVLRPASRRKTMRP